MARWCTNAGTHTRQRTMLAIVPPEAVPLLPHFGQGPVLDLLKSVPSKAFAPLRRDNEHPVQAAAGWEELVNRGDANAQEADVPSNSPASGEEGGTYYHHATVPQTRKERDQKCRARVPSSTGKKWASSPPGLVRQKCAPVGGGTPPATQLRGSSTARVSTDPPHVSPHASPSTTHTPVHHRPLRAHLVARVVVANKDGEVVVARAVRRRRGHGRAIPADDQHVARLQVFETPQRDPLLGYLPPKDAIVEASAGPIVGGARRPPIRRHWQPGPWAG